MLAFMSSSGRSSSTATTDGGMKRKADIRDSFAFQKGPKFIRRSDKDKYCTTMTARWIAMGDMPLDTVENQQFCDMIIVMIQMLRNSAIRRSTRKSFTSRKTYSMLRLGSY
jgi:hypothetical protein